MEKGLIPGTEQGRNKMRFKCLVVPEKKKITEKITGAWQKDTQVTMKGLLCLNLVGKEMRVTKITIE